MFPYSILDSAKRSRVLKLNTEEKDLGMMIRNELKPRPKAQSASSKANMVLARLHIENTRLQKLIVMEETIQYLYVRPHLEYAILAWSPYTKVEQNGTEELQRIISLCGSKLNGF